MAEAPRCPPRWRPGGSARGRRFEWVDEVWIFRFRDGGIVHNWSLEETLGRLRQLGLTDLHG
jgi:hypothetical protein